MSGWLAYFSLGVIVMPVFLAWQVVQAYVEAFKKVTGATPGLSEIHNVALRSMEDWTVAVSLGAIIAMEAAAVWLITLWWRRRKEFPLYWIVFMLCALGLDIVMAALDGNLSTITPKQVVLTLIVVAYWKSSKRVKATFVVTRGEGHQEHQVGPA